ncbi:MAG: hypothetical protein ABEK12_03685 [Candidatus Nanohaloarchaea archaeon]
MRMQRQGQYSLIEQVVLFALGISITIGFLVAFEDLTGDVQEDMAETQTQLVARYLASSTVELAESGSDGELVLSIPGTVADRVYVLRLTGDGARIQTTGRQYTASLYGLTEGMAVSGSVESRAGGIALTREGSSIELGES